MGSGGWGGGVAEVGAVVVGGGDGGPGWCPWRVAGLGCRGGGLGGLSEPFVSCGGGRRRRGGPSSFADQRPIVSVNVRARVSCRLSGMERQSRRTSSLRFMTGKPDAMDGWNFRGDPNMQATRRRLLVGGARVASRTAACNALKHSEAFRLPTCGRHAAVPFLDRPV